MPYLSQALFVDDILIAIKAGKSDQFYEQLNGVYPKVINFMAEVEQGDCITVLHVFMIGRNDASLGIKWFQSFTMQVIIYKF